MKLPPEETQNAQRETLDQAPGGVDSHITETQNGKAPVREIGGRTGLEPTRFGDWEKNGRCIDF